MIPPERKRQQNDEKEQSQIRDASIANDAVEEDGSPVLDEQDLIENNLTVEEADNIEWDEPTESTDRM